MQLEKENIKTKKQKQKNTHQFYVLYSKVQIFLLEIREKVKK